MSECKCQDQKDVNIVCRCEDVTIEEVRACIKQGITDLEMLKRLLRVGMGPCQGRTCIPIIVREIAAATGQPVEDIALQTFRPPTTPVKLGILAGGEEDD